MDLWNEVPEAKLFGESIINSIQNYKLYSTEEFSDFWFGSFATSGVDLQDEAFTPKSLESFVRQINEETLMDWGSHDPLYAVCKWMRLSIDGSDSELFRGLKTALNHLVAHKRKPL
ncbi:MAG: hypothetical protein ACR2G4_03255 [Pyrinomonadaceae bacterium]